VDRSDRRRAVFSGCLDEHGRAGNLGRNYPGGRLSDPTGAPLPGPLEAAMTGIYAKTQRYPALAELIEPTRKEE
jgi:hypothetical protein